LQILFYYDLIVGGCCHSNLSVKIILWIVYELGYSVDYSVLRSRHKNDTAPPPEVLAFMSVAPELSFFMAPAPASGCYHTLIFC